jgi:hypothetical protein
LEQVSVGRPLFGENRGRVRVSDDFDAPIDDMKSATPSIDCRPRKR